MCFPGAFNEEQLTYNAEREIIPVAIHCVAEEPADGEIILCGTGLKLEGELLLMNIFVN